MVFSIDTVKSANKMNFPFVETTLDVDNSFYYETIDKLVEESTEFDALMESINIIKFDSNKSTFPGNILVKIFEWFIEFLEKIPGMIKSFLLNFVNKNAQLQMNKEKLSIYTGKVNYSQDYFNYRNMDLGNTYTVYESEINSEYDKMVAGLDNLKSATNSTDFASALNQLKDEIKKFDTEELRGKVLGLNESLSIQEYKVKLFEYFRYTSVPIQGESNTRIKNIDNRRVREAYDSYYNADKLQKIANRSISKAKACALVTKGKCKMLRVNDYIKPNINISSEIKESFKHLITSACNNIKSICDTYVLFYNEYIRAMKEYTIMNKDILLSALKEMVKES